VAEVLCDCALELDGALGVGHLEAGHIAAQAMCEWDACENGMY